MPELYDEDGNPVEALTKEEADAAVAKAAEDAKAAAAAEAEPKIKELEEKLAKAQDKEKNFEKLRTKTESQAEEEKTLKEQIAEMEKKIDEAKGAGTKVFLDSVKDKAIKSLAGNDAELQKKIEEEYSILNLPADNEDQINERTRRAYLLASGGVLPNNTMRGSFTPPAGSGRPLGQNKSDAAFSPELGEFAQRFGISDEDVKKYGGAKTTKA